VLAFIWIQLGSFNRQDSVDNHVLNTSHKVLFNLDAILSEEFIKVILKLLKSESIAVFMFAIVVTIFL
jgi:hypothetical protein